jgi:hypothetical protein
VESPYPDIPEAKWRWLLGHAAVLRAVASRLDWLVQSPTGGAAASELRDASEDASVTAGDAGDAALVEDVCARWSEKLAARADRPGTSEEDAGKLHELAETAASALPDDPFQWLFGRVVERAAVLYGDWWVPPELGLEWKNSAWDGHDGYELTARAVPGPPPRVTLCLWPNGLGTKTFAAIPATLMHECVCHVPARQAGEIANHSPFVEGFMDFVALLLLEVDAPRIDPDLATAIQVHGHEFNRVLRSGTSPPARDRRYGHLAAQTLVNWFQSDAGLAPHDAGSELRRLAVELNTEDRGPIVKDGFVAKLTRPFPARTVQALHAWLEGRGSAADLL